MVNRRTVSNAQVLPAVDIDTESSTATAAERRRAVTPTKPAETTPKVPSKAERPLLNYLNVVLKYDGPEHEEEEHVSHLFICMCLDSII